MNQTQRSENVIRNVLWHMGDYNNGWQPGSFIEKLLSAWGHADTINSFKLGEAFPDYALAIHLWNRDRAGLYKMIGVENESGV